MQMAKAQADKRDKEEAKARTLLPHILPPELRFCLFPLTPLFPRFSLGSLQILFKKAGEVPSLCPKPARSDAYSRIVQ